MACADVAHLVERLASIQKVASSILVIRSGTIEYGGLAEWLKAPVLKTGEA